jgi:hypothetical protein
MQARTAVALTLSLIALAVFVLEAVSWRTTGSLGGRLHWPGACTARFDTVTADELKVGLKPGDIVDLRKTSWLFRADTLPQAGTPSYSGRVGDVLTFPVLRNARAFNFTEVLIQRGTVAAFLAEIGFKLFFLLVGAFVLWRGKDTASLLLGAWCLIISCSLPAAWFGVLPPEGRVAFAISSTVLWLAAPVVLYFIIEAVVRGLMSPTVIWLTRIALLVFLAPGLLDLTANVLAQIQSGCSLWNFRGIDEPLQIINQAIVLVFFATAYARSRGIQRQRIRWVFWAFLISRFGVLTNLINRMTIHPIHLTGLEWLTVMLFPLGTAYAILRHRIIDVSFVLNRALVYTILTTVTVAFFVLVETFFSNVAVGRGIGLVVEILLALAIGLSFRAFHERIQHWINRTLFRRKHETASALRRFADEAPFIQSPIALVARACDEIRKGMRTDDVRFYQASGDEYRRVSEKPDGQLGELIDPDDPVLVKLRSAPAEIDLAEVETALGSGGYAFPLTVRGKTFGALVCGQRADGEDYAPDERDLLRHVAREVATELFILRSRDQAELLQAIASGLIDPEKARARARSLIQPT